MSTESIKINQEDFGNLAICAIRYCHGRQTYMPSLIQGILKSHLHELSDKDLNVMIDDCEFQERMNLYGDNTIDKPGWLTWKKALLEEKESRTTKYIKEDTGKEYMYVVTYWNDNTTEPIVTVFDNQDNANKMYDEYIKNFNCCVDRCEVYSTFTVK
jgi:hypothetical protein